MLNGTLTPMLSEGSFGHAGAGVPRLRGAYAGIGFGYVMCQMGDALTGDPRATNLVDAVRSCLP